MQPTLDLAQLETESRSLAAVLCAPPHPFEARCREALDRGGDVEASWALLLKEGLLPSEFETARRLFAEVEAPRPRLSLRLPPAEEWTPFPPGRSAFLCFGSNPMGMLEAEAHLQVLMDRLSLWGEVPTLPANWCSVRGHLPRAPSLPYVFDLASWSLQYALEQEDITIEGLLAAEVLPKRVQQGLVSKIAWDLALELELEVPGAHWPPSAIKGVPFATLPNPFEAALDLWRTGYLLHVSHSEEGAPEQCWLYAQSEKLPDRAPT